MFKTLKYNKPTYEEYQHRNKYCSKQNAKTETCDIEMKNLLDALQNRFYPQKKGSMKTEP